MLKPNPKLLAASKAVELVEPDMIVGLGTGSTAKYFIEALGKRCEEGLKITGVATSIASEQLAKKMNIPLLPYTAVSFLDLTIDGADEMDPSLNLIKGGGGALLREKILATSSREMVVIVDESKCVDKLGTFPLPVEIVPFCYNTTLKKLKDLGYSGTLRYLPESTTPYLTDNSHYIFDLKLDKELNDPFATYDTLIKVVGVVEVGFFLTIAKKAVVGYKDGNIKFLTKLK